MLELTGVVSILRGIGVLCWLLAIGAIVLALYKNKTPRARAIWATVAVLVFGFLPAKQMVEQYQKNAFAKEAWSYFKHKCDTEAGEKIYKTFTAVKSVLVVKPLPSATDKDHFDQFWHGDPYSASATSVRTEQVISRLAWADGPVSPEGRGPGFEFVESVVPGAKTILRYSYPKGTRDHVKQVVDRSVSRFSIAWEDISTPEDRKYWVAGSRLQVVDLESNSVVAERIGYLIEAGFGSTTGQRRPWLASRGIGPNGRTCPQIHDYADRLFLLKVFKMNESVENGK